MAESSRRFRNSTSRSIAASSAIALALGGLSVVGPGPLAPHAAASDYTGGIRDKSGAVEEEAQKASDLPAGSCVVKSEEPSGSQAGFSWDHLEPSGSSPDKKAWGLSVSFDNSKDRTFADWYFSNSGNLSNVLDAGQVSSMEAGQTFDGKSVTHKAGENIDISAFGRTQRNLNLYAELTDEKVKQFASASAGNPVRYAWQSNYKQNNPDGPYATKGGSASFGATVNPWPSENIECNPITVSWETAEVSEKHVIVPGEETKVGTISIPALQNGGTDDSMSRMVVEAYDGNGKFIGTTDPEASGGEQLLRIDEATGDIYFTWPEYRGTDLATDKNVNFSVLAKPRTVAQLQAASDNNTYEKAGKAFDSSNSLDRYSKANVIDSTSFSLDDTEYHDPQYDKTDASIISGVDSATGPIATEPQKVTFTQVPDKIAELVKKRDAGGFEAEVTLDEKYVYEGWSVEMDEDYNVTVTAPENPKPGTFARPVVTVEYSNGSTDELELFVVVDPNNTQVTDLVRPGLTKGTIGDDLTAQIGTKPIMKGYKAVHPAKYEVDPSTVPDGWTVTVDNTGKVTAKADDTVAPGTIITPTVKATYPDDTTDEIETQFQAIVDIKVPDYDTVTNKPGTDVSLTPTVPELGLSGNTTDKAPTRYTFEDGKTEYTHTDDSGTWTVKIDENTGEITTTIPRTAPEGYILNVPVLAHYDNADKPQQVKGTVVVLRGDIAPVYSVESTGPNTVVNHQVQDAPEGSTFSFGTDKNGAPITDMETADGWKYTVDPNTGVVSSTPPAGSKPGDKKTITVDVVTPAGDTPKVPVTTVVNLTNAWEAEPIIPPQTVYPGNSRLSTVEIDKPENINVDKSTLFESDPLPENVTRTGRTNGWGNPVYEVQTENGTWTVSLDSTGNVVSTAPRSAKPGDKIEVPLTVTYGDGSTNTANAVINVVDFPTRPKPFETIFQPDETLAPGETRVQQEGVLGEEKETEPGKWETTKEPVTQIVLIGTKPSEAGSTQTWLASTPYNTVLRPNPDLKPGEVKTIQEGQPGQTQYTVDFKAVGDQAETKPVETELKKPVDQIIEYGPQLDDDKLVVTTKKPVVFETKVIFDENLVAGRTVTDQEGHNGEITVTSTQKLVDGRPSGSPVVTEEVTKEKKDAVVRVGTMTEGEITNKYEVDVPYPVEIVYDDKIPAGTTEIKQEGEPGKKTTTVTQKIRNSKPFGDPEMTFDETKAPTPKIILVGTKQAQSKSDVTWTEPIPYPTELRPAEGLAPGETRVAQEGEDGEVTYTAKFTAAGGEAEVDEGEVRKPAKPRIVEYGLQTDSDDYVVETTRHIPFETKVVFDETLQEGQQVIEQGVVGQEAITATQKIVNGRPTGDPVITTRTIQEPKNAVIRIGVKPTPDIVDKIKVPIPFETKIEYDPEMPAGTSETVTEGKLGEKEITTTRKVTDGVPGDPEVTEEVITEPVNQVIKVGTKPSETSEKVEWKVPVPFEVETRPNPELKPGEVKVVQNGAPGEKTYSADFSAKGDQATVTPDEKQTKDPVNEIIEYGPAAEDTSVVTKTEKPVPFETEIVFDDTLAEGEQVVDQQGEHGTDVETATQQIVDGKPSGDPVVNTERTKEPVKQIIRVGTKTAGQTVNSVEAEIPFPTKIVYDPTLAPGETKVTQEGKPGTKKVTVTQPVENSQPKGEATSTEEVLTPPTEQIIAVGTKPDEATEQVTWTAPVPFDTVVRPNPALKPGEVKVVTEGVLGEKTFTADFSSKGSDATVTPKEEQTKDPVDALIEYGPTIADQTLTSTKTREVAFETEIVFDDTLPAGEQVVDQQGEKGEELITSTQEIKDGKPSGEPTISTKETKAPKKAIIRVGMKQVEPDEPAPAPSPSVEPLTVELPYPVKYEFDPNLPTGEEVVDQEGTPGAKTLRPKLEMVDGKPVWTIEEVETQKPVQRVVRVGTKQAETNPFVWTSEVPYNTIVRPSNDPNLAPGETKVIQLGENGSTKYSANPETGEVTKLEGKKPVERIVEYRPDVNDDALVTRLTRPVPFETEVVYDPNLPEGAQRIEQGEFGEEVETTTQQIKDGKPFGDPAKNTERTREPKNAVIRIGTKKTPENASVTELEVPPTTQLIFDPSLEPGEQVVVREGTPGTVRVTTVDGETSVENTLDSIPRLVRVGAKQPDQLNWLEPLPFKVITRENPDLPAGEHKVVQEGQPGLVQHVGDTATTITEPQDYILEIGVAKEALANREVVVEPIPFETEIVEDDSLAAGTFKVDQQGANGSVRTTKEWASLDDEPQVTTETLSEPTSLIIRVGTGKPAEETPEQPEKPEPETPVEDQKGSSAERCVANAFAANSPLLWLLPIGLLGAIGYGVNEMYGPQINQAAGALNARWEAFVRENTPDFGHGHRGIEKPEWVRQAEAQANALNQQFNQRFTGYGEQLRPVGIALGALAAVALTGTLIAQACSEEGFDNGMTVLGSTERKLDFGALSEKADGANAESSSREAGSSKKNALTTAAKPAGEK